MDSNKVSPTTYKAKRIVAGIVFVGAVWFVIDNVLSGIIYHNFMIPWLWVLTGAIVARAVYPVMMGRK